VVIQVDVPTVLTQRAKELLEALDEELRADPAQTSQRRAVGARK
jgi:hypothetical protein